MINSIYGRVPVSVTCSLVDAPRKMINSIYGRVPVNVTCSLVEAPER